MFDLAFFKKKPNLSESRKVAAEILKVHPEALEAFEKAYTEADIKEKDASDNLFDINSRDAVAMLQQDATDNAELAEILVSRIVDELLSTNEQKRLAEASAAPVTNEEICKLPENLRPQLTGHLLKVDINEPSYLMLLEMLTHAEKEKSLKKRRQYYQMFRQGLDILDLDPVTYEIIGMNRNTMSYWLPALEEATSTQSFFRIPKTKILKVPLPILQLTRCDYMGLTPITLDIVNRWAYEAFELDENKTYFVKTGTYSSKFDFRNARVTTPKEVRELGSYLLFIHFQALQMASPLSKPCIYGASTTNEWCVREYIEPPVNTPTIYHGLPLRTEFRVFIDCDTDEILGVSPYWRSDVMLKRFEQADDADSADMKHDAIIFRMQEENLMKNYNENVDTVRKHVKEMLPNLNLPGQWSLDVMLNGNDFWLIDMATADTSALNDCVPKGMLKKSEENWIPELGI